MAPARITPPVEQSPSSSTKQGQSKPPVFKVIKPGIKRQTKKLPKALQRPLTPLGGSSPVKIRADGLLDVEEIPPYLMDAVQRNAVQSPLLRLDSKIRMRIWAFAMGGHTIEIMARKAGDIAEDGTSTTRVPEHGSPYMGKVAHQGPKRSRPKTAFRLPEVCRLIYQETATLGYTTNQFGFIGEVGAMFGREQGPDGALEGWCRERIPAHINAVTSIRPHWHDLQDYLSKNNMKTFKQLFPCLKQLRVPSRAVNCQAKWPHRGDPMGRHLRQQAKERIAAMIKDQEGDDVEVVFFAI